ncbi:MAG: NusG domain II-containing protein [Gammaproteobacteria bacterium]|nr:NusG domain II-containing protein [Gammaproteobacteria bacterium]
MKSGDVIILFLAALLNISLFIGFWHTNAPAGMLEVYLGKQRIIETSLDRDRIITVSGSRGQNEIEIRDGRARFITSPCANKFCIHYGWLAWIGEAAACLPNQISISLTGDNRQFDSINY